MAFPNTDGATEGHGTMDFLTDDDVAAFRSSGEFDERWYVEEYPDVKIVGMDPAKHYLWLGERLGRWPSANARHRRLDALKSSGDSHWKSREKKLKAELDALEPASQRLAGSSLLDAEFVCKQLDLPFDSDRLTVARAYYANARKRPLRPNPLFDPEYYRHANALGFEADPVEHYLLEGGRKHLPCHFLFDADWYKSQFPDAAFADDLIEHYWAVGYRQKVLPFDPAQAVLVAEICKLFFIDVDAPEYAAFDPWIYRTFNPDLDGSDDHLTEHYRRFGSREGRIGDAAALFSHWGALPRFVPFDFTAAGYTEVHFDLSQLYADQSINCFEHYMCHGLAEGRAYSLKQLFGYFAPDERKFSVDLIQTQEKTALCVLVHLYYPEMWDELRKYIRNIEVSFDLYVNLVDTTWTSAVVHSIREDFPTAKVYISANAGRDIGGFVRLMDCVDFDKYIAFAMLHSKKSPHVTDAFVTRWKQSLLSAILGSPEIVAQNIAAFIEDSSIGIIGSGQNRQTSVASNGAAFDYLLNLYGVEEKHSDCEYISGTMMMVRSELMRNIYEPICDLDFELGDGKDLSFHIDGQFEHAIERVFGNVMKQRGMRFLWH